VRTRSSSPADASWFRCRRGWTPPRLSASFSTTSPRSAHRLRLWALWPYFLCCVFSSHLLRFHETYSSCQIALSIIV
jgi:hypothetical protein